MRVVIPTLATDECKEETITNTLTFWGVLIDEQTRSNVMSYSMVVSSCRENRVPLFVREKCGRERRDGECKCGRDALQDACIDVQ